MKIKTKLVDLVFGLRSAGGGWWLVRRALTDNNHGKEN